MNRDERLSAISSANEDSLVDLADRVLSTLNVEVVRGPAVGLLMMRVEEPSDRLVFNFTEVTVPEAEVNAGGERGYAMVMGRAPEKALAGAILDVAVELGHESAPEIERTLRSAMDSEQARRDSRLAEVAPTRVRFEEMRLRNSAPPVRHRPRAGGSRRPLHLPAALHGHCTRGGLDGIHSNTRRPCRH